VGDGFLFVFDGAALPEGNAGQRIVKAQLGVRLGADWLNLYEGPDDRAYAARMENLELLKRFSTILGRSSFYSSFEIAGCRYGRYLLGIGWSATERYLLYRSLLADFFDRYRPATIQCAGLGNAHPVDARAFRAFCAERQVAITELPAGAPPAPVEGGLWKGCAGAYAGFGSLGRERLFYRSGDPSMLYSEVFPVDPGNGGLRFDQHVVPSHCHFPLDASSGAFAGWRFRYLHVPGAKLRIQLVAAGKAVDVAATSAGWGCGKESAWQSLGPVGPMYPGQGLLIQDDRGYFFCDGMPSVELPLTRTDLPDGLHVSADGQGECYAYLDRILLTEAPDAEAAALFRSGPAAFVKPAEPVAPAGPRHVTAVSLFHPAPCVAPPVHGRVPRLAPFYQDGWDEFPAHDVAIRWVSAQEPWRLDGGLLRSDDEEYLYRPIDIDFAPLRESWQAALDKDFERVAAQRSALLEAWPHEDFVDFFLSNMKAGLPTVAAIAGDALRLGACLDDIAPDALVGARVDNAFPWAVAAARARGIPALSSEISFIYHEIHRLHRLSDQPETTDAISVWGFEHARRIEEMGLSSPAIRCAGLPALDLHKRCPSALALPEDQRQELAAYLGFRLKPGPVVLYGGWFGGRNPIYDADEFRNAIAALLEAMAPLGGGNVLIKSISMDDPLGMRAALSGLDMERVHILHPQQPFHNAYYIALADLHVALPTTMLAESLAQRCPTVALWAGTHGSWYPVSRRQVDLLARIVPVARSYAELTRIVRDTLAERRFEPPAEPALRELFGSLREDSTGRLARILSGLVHGEERGVLGHFRGLWPALVGRFSSK